MELIRLPNLEPEPKRHWFNDPDKIRLLAAVLTIGAAAVNAFGRSQKTTWVLLAGIAGLLISLALPLVVRRTKEHRLFTRNRHLVAQERKKLERFLEKFTRMCLNRSNSRTFLYILYDSAKFDRQVVEQIIGYDFIPAWTQCFANQIKTPCFELKPFLGRCNEFCVIVRLFAREYVSKAQKQSVTSVQGSENALAELEAFREEFAQFLREVEDWVDALNNEAHPQLTYAEQVENCPSGHFDRAKPFLTKVIGARSGTQ
jgi:hypothetical protein